MLDKLYIRLLRLVILTIITLNFICFLTTFNPKALINPFFIKNRTISCYFLLKHIIFVSGIPTKIKDMDKINKTVESVSKKHMVDPLLIHAVIKVESKYNPFAISKTGAMGLMQLMPKTFFSLGFENPFDIEQNIEAGTMYLSTLLKRFNSLELALSAYNAGPSSIVNNSIPNIGETKHYVKKIIREYNQLKTQKASPQ
ncbi:conserved hypothetical protein [Deferribacter desulfuricans SSM1]|uniref:Transglycosylase SLT domain-containing protein n=1 Tax=Deferribacter desulfuricans (strain DSM 14783 / JCM 11476 / NBRC 101012 / SSM1) TaxID=639282 RepID=D3PDD8_DEFDS|nr:lytic transglycosylase domain-containing protein [Deferribacter desulfuricans]BAI80611.1 conserved hypothetical protein [Deferribacter desulfuricans SSM1]